MRTPTEHGNWNGASHSRMTRSMEYLPLAAKAILMHLRRIIRDYETRIISQAEIVRGAQVSESTVSKYMPLLIADGWVARSERQATGRGHGYAITVLPPPELIAAESLRSSKGSRPANGIVPHTKGSSVDPDADPSFAAPGAEIPHQEGSSVDPSNDLDHEHQQQQQSEADSDLREALAGDDPQVVIEVIRFNPGLTKADLDRAIALADRPGVHNPRGLALHCLRTGATITPARRKEPRAGPRSRVAPWDTAETIQASVAAIRAEQCARNAGDAVPPDDATPDELATWRHYTEHGDFTPVEALNLLLMARYHDQRQALIPSREARYVSH